MDINSSKTKKNDPDIDYSDGEQSDFSMQIKQYRKELKDELDNSFINKLQISCTNPVKQK